MGKIEICAVGGYDEVGKNMTAVNVDGTVILLDMGLNLEEYISYTEGEEGNLQKFTADELIAANVVPNITYIKDWIGKVAAIIPTHAHLDHLGAIPLLANYFNAQVICTPFSAAVLKRILQDEKISVRSNILALKADSTYSLTPEITIEFISITHSTPHTVMVAIHTKYGVLIYANDFKIDHTPVLGAKPNIKRLTELGNSGVLGLIMESTYALDQMKTPSEIVAKQMLKEVLLHADYSRRAIIVTTFSSHIARLKSIIECGKKLNRKILFLGRSLAKYSEAAQEVGIANFSKDAEIVKYGSLIKKTCKRINIRNRHKYMYVVTGHQGEPRATLSKMIDKKLPFKFMDGDIMVFSCKTIPTPTNIANKQKVEEKLSKMGVRIFKDVHVSGHAAREDLREMLEIIRPKHFIPAHGNAEKTNSLGMLAESIGIKNVHVVQDGDKVVVD